MNFYLSTALVPFHKFDTFCLFSIRSKHFLVFFVIFLSDSWFNFQIFGEFYRYIFLVLSSSLILLWPENILCKILIPLNLLRIVLWLIIMSTLFY